MSSNYDIIKDHGTIYITVFFLYLTLHVSRLNENYYDLAMKKTMVDNCQTVETSTTFKSTEMTCMMNI